MKIISNLTSRFSKQLFYLGLFLAVGFVFFGNASSASAAVKDWSCTAGTTAWATGSNWVGGAAPVSDTTTDIARFNCTSYTNQPTLAASASVAGIVFGDGSTAVGATTITVGNPRTLTIGASGVDVKAGVSGTPTITGTAIALGAAQTWQNANTTPVLTVSAPTANGGFLLTVGGAGDTTVSAIISGTGGITKSGAGTFTSSAAHTFSGAVIVSVGTYKFGVASATSASGPTGTNAGGISVTAGATLDLAGRSYTSTQTEALSLNGTGISGGGALMNSGAAATYIGIVTFTTDASIVGGSGTIGLTGTPASGTTTMTLGGAAGGSITTIIAGARVVVKEGAGTWTLSGVNTYSAGTTIKAGILKGTTSASAFGTNTITIGDLGGSLDATLMGGFAGTHTNAISVASGNSGIATITNSVSNAVFSGAIAMSHNLVLATTSTFNMSVATVGNITGTGNLILSTTGSGILTIGATGGQTINMAGTIDDSTSSGSVAIAINGIIGTNVTNVIQNNTTTPMTLSGANTFTNNGSTTFGLDIKAGTLTGNTSASALGAGAVDLGATSGNANATLTLGSVVAYANTVNVISGSSSNTLKILTSTTGITYGGPIVLANNLTVASSTTGTLTFTGGVTGTGNLTINNTGTTSLTSFTTAAVNNIGTITNISATSGTNTITGGVGSNVTAITQNSTTSALTISTTGLTVNSSGTTLTNTAGTKALTVSSAIGGTGNLILDNDSTMAAGVTVAAVNNAGTVTNSGAGTSTSTVTITGVIGTSVTNVIQNSAGSLLGLTGVNTFTNNGSTTFGLTIKSGTVTGATSASAFGAGAITLGDSVVSQNVVLSGNGALTFANLITVASGNAGTATIQSSGANAIFSGAVTMNDALTLAASANNLTMSGGFSGTADLTIATSGAGTITLSGQSTNNTGKITNNGGGGGLTTISGGVGTSVTDIIEASTTSSLTVSTTAVSVGASGKIFQNTLGTGILTISGGVTGSGNVTIDNDSATDSAVTISGTSINNTGTITNQGGGAGKALISAVIGSNVTSVIQNSSSSLLEVSGASTLSGSVLVSSGSMTNTNTLSIGTTLTISNGGTFTQGAFALTVNGTMTVGSGATGIFVGSASGLTLKGDLTFNLGGTWTKGAGTVTFSKGATQTITAALPYAQNLGTVATATASTNVVVGTIYGVSVDSLTIAGSTTFDISTRSIYLNGASPLSITGTFSISSGTVYYQGTNQAVANLTYNNLYFLSGSITTGTVNATIAGTFYHDCGTFSPSAGTITFNNGAIYNDTCFGGAVFFNVAIASGATVSSFSTAAIAGTLTVNSSATLSPSSGTITMNNGSSIVNSGTLLSFQTLAIANSATVTANTSFTVKGNMTVGTSAVLSPTSGTYTLNGNFTNNGTFTASGSHTMVMATTATATIAGASTFFNFTAATATKVVNFTAGQTFITNGLLTLTNVVINSTTGSSSWTINHQGTESITGTSITWAACDGASTTITVTSGTNGGNNGVCWSFPAIADAYWVGGAGNWSDATNHWAITSGGSPGAGNIPISTTDVHFDSSSCSGACAIAIDSSVTVDDFLAGESDATITASGTVTATSNMTVSAGTFKTAQAVDGSVTVTGTLLVDTSGTFVVRYKSLSVPTAAGSGQTITAATLTINGNMNADAQGFAVNAGPGAGSYSSGGSGGGYGGVGGNGVGGAAAGIKYGSATSPIALGSGGGSNGAGVSGGGAIKLVVSGTTTVAGTLSAKGGDETSPRGGGSGGSIWISSGTLAGAGTISAAGGVGGQGGGGGGRMDISGTTNTFTGTLSVLGGVTSGSSGGNVRGRAGTIAFPSAQLSNFTLSNNLTLGSDITYAFGDLTVTSSSTLTLDSDPTAGSGNGTGTTITATNITVNAGSFISVDAQGFGIAPTIGAGYGPGTGDYNSGGSGGGMGGEGGATSAAGGGTYGSITSPTAIGSAGGFNGLGENTAGGGAATITVSSLLTLNGTISANGNSPSSPFGGGSGGSLNITSGTVAGSGTIRANGATSNYGGGGGGRVAMKLTSGSSFASLVMTAYGGAGSVNNGAAGTVYTELAAQTGGLGVLTIDNNNVSTASGTDTSISSLTTGTSVGSIALTASKAGKLTVETSQTLTTTNTGTTLTTGTGTTLTNNGTLSLSGTTFTNGGTLTNGGSSTITYTGQANDAAVTILNTTYQGLTVNNAGTTFSLPATTTVSGALGITAGTLDQGATYSLTSGAVTVGASGIWNNIGTGDVTLSSSVSNAGTITLKSNNSTACSGTDDIVIASSAAVQRTWSGAGTFNIYNVSASYQAGSITVYNSNDGGNNGWTFSSFGCITDAYWVGGTGNWSDATTHWATSSGGSPGAGNIPLSTTNVYFDSSSGTGTVTLNTGSITVANFSDTSTNITVATSTNGITITGDMTVNGTVSGATAVTLNSSSKSITGGSGGTISAPVTLGATRTVAVSTGTFTMSGIISGSGFGLTKTGAGQLNLSGANTFTGGLTVKAGVADGATSVNAFGANASTITIGDTSGSADSRISSSGSLTFVNPITVASGNSGVASIYGDGTLTFSGAISLSHDLKVFSTSTHSTTLSGGVTGTGNITTDSDHNGSIAFTTNTMNMTGTFTNLGGSDGFVAISSVIGTNVTGVVENSSTSSLTLSGVNTFTSGITIKAGNLISNTSANALGANANVVTIGDTSGSADATLTIDYSGTVANPVTTASGSSGIATLVGGTGSTNALTISGAITLNKALTIYNNIYHNDSLTLTGGVTGTGNLIITDGLDAPTIFSGASLNNTGTITNTSGAAGATTISAVIGTNVTGVIQNSLTSELDLSGINTFTSGLQIKSGVVGGSTNSSAFGGSGGTITIGETANTASATLSFAMNFSNPITVASGGSANRFITRATNDPTVSGAITLSNDLQINDGTGFINFTGGVTGTGNLTLNTTSSGGITLATTSVNMTGTITNSGSGAGGNTISAAIGTNVTAITQNSATSSLTISGTNSYTGPVTNSTGTLFLASSNTFSTITLGASTTTTLTAGITITVGTNLISNGGSGTEAILNSSSAGSPATLTKASGTITVTYLSIKDSTATGGATWNAFTSSGNINVSGNTGWVFVSTPANAYWVGGTGNWSDAATHWATSSGGSAGAANLPGSITNVFFDSSSGTGTVTMNTASVTVANFTGTSTNIIVATSTNGITITGDSTINKTISGATAVTFSGSGKTITGGSAGLISAPVVLGATQIVNVASGTFTMSGIVSGSSFGITKTGSAQLTLSGANTFTGGLTIKAGTVQGTTSTSSLGGTGTGTVTLGDTSGSTNATLDLGSSITYANPITVASGSSGTLTIAGSGNGISPTLSGAVTLSNNLSINLESTAGVVDMTLSGGITGTGNIIINNNDTTNSNLKLTTTTINNTGTITNSGSGAGNAVISSIIGTNVTGVVENSSTSILTLSGANTFTSGLTIKSGVVIGDTSANALGANANVVTIGDTAGSANATLRQFYFGSFANPITVASGSSGTLTIQGTSSGSAFSSPVTLNNALTLSSTNSNSLTMTGGFTGTGNLTTKSSGTGTITLSTTSINPTGTITNSGTGSGTITISAAIGSNITSVIQNSSTSSLSLSGAKTLSGSLVVTSGTLTHTSTLSVGTTLTVSDGGTFTQGAGLLTVSGNTTIGGGTSGIFTASTSGQTLNGNLSLAVGSTWTKAASGNLTFSHGSGGQTITDSTASKQDLGNVKVSVNGTNTTLTLASDSKFTTLTTDASQIFNQGASYKITTGTVTNNGTWTNTGTGDITLSGDVANAGTITLNSSAGSQCTDITDDIVITSSVGGTQRNWTGAGTFTVYNVNYTDMTGSGVTAYTSTASNSTWTVGSCGATYSGTVYTDEGSTAMTSGPTVKVVVNGGSSYTAVANGSGVYSVTGITVAAGNPIAIFLDTNGGNQANLVTRATGTGDLSGLNLYQNRVIVRHEDAGPTTNANLDQYDNGNDADMMFTVTTNNAVYEDGAKLLVWTGKTYTPGGTITTDPSASSSSTDGDIGVQASATLAMGTNALSIGGDFVNAGTFSSSGSPQITTFTATATGHTIDNGTGNLDKVVFNGSGGGWSFSDASNSTGVLTMTNGTLSGTTNLTVFGDANGTGGIVNLTGGTFTQVVGTAGGIGATPGWTFNNLTFGSGSGAGYSPFGSGSITISGVLTVTGGDGLSGGGNTWILSGSGTPFVKTGSFTAQSSTFQFTGTSATNIPAATYNILSFLPTSGSPTYTFTGNVVTNGAVTIGNGSNAVTVDQGATFNLTTGGALSVAASATWSNTGTGDITLAGNVSNAGIITLKSNNSTSCSGTDDIVIASSAAVQRTWSGGGTFNINNVSASYQTGSITVYDSTNTSNNGWTFTSACITTLGNGTDGSSSTIGPGAAATEIGRFSLATNTGTDTVTGLTVTLGPTSAYTNIGTVAVLTTGGVSKCSATPSSNTVVLTSCAIAVTTTPTDYVIKITPLSHGSMPAVPGASYATTATVTSITATNPTAGTDSGSATITVDNASPAGVTSSTVTAGNTLNSLAWTNPADSDFTTSGTVVVLRRTTSAVTDVPVEGTTYSVSNTIGSSTVACVNTGSAPTPSCTDTGLTNGTAYYYKIFTQDSRGNYDAGTTPTGSPATPTAPGNSYWVGGTGNWSDAATHWASSSGGSPSALNLPGSSTNVFFNSNSGSGTVTIDTASVSVVDFNKTKSDLSVATSTNGITITGDMTVAGTVSGATAVTLNGSSKSITGSSGGTISAPVVLGATRTVAVASGTFTMSGIISDGGSAYGLIKTGANELALSGANTFTGGLNIKAGIVSGSTSNNAFGANTSTITLGDTSGSVDTTLKGSGPQTFANPITVASGNSGIATLYGWGYDFTLSGAISISHDLVMRTQFSNLVVTGGITGTGNITLNGLDTSVYKISLTTTSINNTGTITNSGTGTVANLISAVIGTNVTGVVQNSATSGLDLTTSTNTFTTGVNIKAGTVTGSVAASFGNGGTITVGDTSGSANAVLSGAGAVTFTNPITIASGSSGTATITDSAAATFSGAVTMNKALTVAPAGSNITMSGGFSGTANLVLGTTGAGTITLNGSSVNNTGTITNSGSGSGTTTINSAIGSNVTSVIQNSSTSQLTLFPAAPISLSGSVVITSGTLTNTTSLTVGTTLTVSDGGTFTQGGALVVNGNTTIGGGTSGVFTAYTTGPTLRGNLTLAVGSTWTKGASGNLTFAHGSGGQTITDNTASKQDLGNVKVSVNSTNTTLTLASDAKFTTLTTDSSQIFDQGATYSLVSGSVTNNGTWSNIGTGDITLSGGVSNAGTITIQSNNSTACLGTDDIVIASSAAVQRTWSGAGTFNIYNVSASYQAGSITTYNSTDGGNNGWTFGNSGCTTTLGNGTDGASSTVGPGASATEIGRFSLVTNAGTDTVTGLTVTLAPTNAYTNIGTVDIQTTGGASKCSTTPSSNTVLLTSCAIAVTTSGTEYVIKITPLSHGSMPAVPGASYATTATVTSITSTNTPAGSDTGSATITVDNASPAGVTASTVTAGSTIVDVAWTNPADSDFTTSGTVVVLRRTTSVVTDVPVEGTTYSVGNTIGSSTVVCVVAGSPPATTCQDTGLSNGTPYYYKIFTQDSRGNYNAGTVPTGSPVTPAVTVVISGTVYGDESGNAIWPGCSATTNIAISVNGGTKSNVVCDKDTGVFTVNKTVSTNNIVAVYLDTAGGDKGVLYTRAVNNSTNITGLSLTKNTIWLRYETGSSITNSDISTYDKTNDADIPVDSNGTNITGDDGVELHVDTSKTFAPGGNVDVDNIHVKGTYSGSSETVTVGNGLRIASGGTFSAPTSLVLRGDLFNDGTFTHNSNTVSVNPGVAGYQYSRSMTVDHTKVSTSNQLNFPVLVSGTYTYLKTTQNGGRVQNASGYDVGFFANSDCSSGKLFWETETYTASSGLVNYWVRLPSISSSTDTVFYMCYSNSNISTDQSNTQGTWDPSYKAVYHLADGSTLTANDSTYAGNNGSLVNTPTATTGQIYGGANFVGASTQYINIGNISTLNMGTQDWTTSAWVKTNNVASFPALVSKFTFVGGGTDGWWMGLNGSGRVGAGLYKGGRSIFSVADDGATVNNNAWHYITTTWTRSGNIVRYVDGSATGTNLNISSESAQSISNTRNVRLGVRDEPTDYLPYTGNLDEVKISSVARSAGWIATEYNNQSSPSTFYTVGSEKGNGLSTTIGGTNNITFNNFTVSSANGGGKFLKFQSGNTYTFSGAFSATGQPGNILAISSTTASSPWTTTFNSTATISYLSVLDSACSGGNNTSISFTVINLGNNGACWIFRLLSGGGGGAESSATPGGSVGGGGVGGGGGGSEGGSGGSGAAGTAVMQSGTVSSVTITSGGSGYGTTPPLVSFCNGGGSGATGTAVLSGGAVVSVTITSAGANYSGTPTVLFGGRCGGGAGGGGGGDSGFLYRNNTLASAIISQDPAGWPLAYLASFLLWW